jgi:uncharacterized cupredoxin-like copper-binding protein
MKFAGNRARMKRLLMIGPIAAIAVTGCGSSTTTEPAPRAAAGKVPVSLTDFKVNAPSAQLKAGKTEFDVTNAGKVEHELIVIDTSKPAARLAKGGKASESGKVGEVAGLKPGDRKTLVVNLQKGHYALICNDPGHYMAGMHMDLVVT